MTERDGNEENHPPVPEALWISQLRVVKLELEAVIKVNAEKIEELRRETTAIRSRVEGLYTRMWAIAASLVSLLILSIASLLAFLINHLLQNTK